IRFQELFDALDQVLCARLEAAECDMIAAALNTPVQETVAVRAAPEVIDWQAALEGLNGDRKLLAELSELLLTETPKLLEQSDVAIARSDATLLKIAAHTLKGSLSHFAAPTAFAAALRLETSARD